MKKFACVFILIVAILVGVTAYSIVTAYAEEHEHTPKLYWDGDEKTHFKMCSVCGEKISGTSVKHTWVRVSVGPEGHTNYCNECNYPKGPSDNNIVPHQMKHGTCKVCGYTNQHTHTPKPYWDGDEKTHFKMCSACGEKISGTSVKHTWVQVSVGLEGHTNYCSECNYPKGPSDNNIVPHQMKHGTCKICGYTNQHTHTPKPYWDGDEKTHFIMCSECGEKISGTSIKHTWVRMSVGPEGHTNYCSECNYPKGPSDNNIVPHQMKYGTCEVCGYSSNSNENASKVVLIGDSRTVQMYQALHSDNNIDASVCLTESDGITWSAYCGKGIEWMESNGVPDVEDLIGQGTKVVILMGVNDLDKNDAISEYIQYIKNKTNQEWNVKGADVYFVSVNPVNDELHYFNNDMVSDFNQKVGRSLEEYGVKYIDTYSAILPTIKDRKVSSDGMHYDADTYQKIFNMVMSAIK